MSFLPDRTLILPDDPCVREKKFVDFYYKILKDYFSFEEKIVLPAKETLESGSNLQADDFQKDFKSFQFAYLYLNGIHDTCTSLEMFYKSTIKYSKIFQRLSCKTRIKLCCMESSSLFAALGICYVINEALSQFGFLSSAPTRIQIFFIDVNHRWKELCQYIVSCANSEYKHVELHLTYPKGNGREKFTEEVQLSIQKSHIVIMSKFLSQFPARKTPERILKNTLAEMKKNAILFCLDYKRCKHLDTIKCLMSKNEDFSEILRSEEQFVFCESTETYQFELYKSIFPFRSNSEFPPVLFLTWIKSPNIVFKDKVDPVLPVQNAECSGTFRAKVSANSLRNSKGTFKLVGKFSHVDMEKKNKDDTNRKMAKEASVSRYANFDEDY